MTLKTTDITTLQPADRALIVLSSVKAEEHLQSLVTEATAITDVVDADGREQAHRMGMKLRSARTTIEKTGKAARDDANAFSKAVIDEQKRLVSIIEGDEKRVIGLRDGYDAKLEAEKEAKAAAERARVADIKRKIDGIRALPLALAGASADEISAELAAIDQFEPQADVFAEFLAECVNAIDECVGALQGLHARVLAQEAASALVETERKALEEANRISTEALAAERKELEAARAAMAKERAELEALRAAAAAPVVVNTGSAIELAQDTETTPEEDEAFASLVSFKPALEVAKPALSISPSVRAAAIATADQFHALAGKCYACGAHEFGTSLQVAADALREGQYDSALAGADFELLVSFDTALLDSTVACIEAMQVAA